MFGKLLKHEFRSVARPLGLASLVTLVTAILCGFVFFQRIQNPFNYIVFGDFFQGIIIASAVIFLLLYLLVPTYYLVYRFYRRHFCDEGYLTFTLPATTHEHLLSSIANILIWNVITGIVALLSIIVIVCSGMGDSLDLGLSQEELEMIINGNSIHPIGFLLDLLTSPLYTTVILMTAVTAGCTFAHNHKLLASFGFYYGGNLILGELLQFFNEISMEDGIFWLPAMVRLGLAAGSYFLMHYLIEKRLNI